MCVCIRLYFATHQRHTTTTCNQPTTTPTSPPLATTTSVCLRDVVRDAGNDPPVHTPTPSLCICVCVCKCFLRPDGHVGTRYFFLDLLRMPPENDETADRAVDIHRENLKKKRRELEQASLDAASDFLDTDSNATFAMVSIGRRRGILLKRISTKVSFLSSRSPWCATLGTRWPWRRRVSARCTCRRRNGPTAAGHGCPSSPPGESQVYALPESRERCKWRFLCRKCSRSKRIDVISRITFPLVFALFNLVYWSTYLFRDEEDQ